MQSPHATAAQQTAAVLRALAATIDDSGRGVADVEAALAMAPGRLRRVLKGGQALLYEDLLRILDLVEEDPARFWKRVFPAPGKRRALYTALSGLGL